MNIKIKNIGQLKNVSLDFNKQINIIYAENGTGKTTVSRLLDSIDNQEALYKIKEYCLDDHSVNISFDNKKLNFQNSKWDQNFNNIYVFNQDYYSQNIISKIGDRIYLGDDKVNKIRSYSQIWKWILELKKCDSKIPFFKKIFSTKELFSLLRVSTVRPIFDWYRPVLKLTEFKKISVTKLNYYISIAELEYERIKTDKDKLKSKKLTRIVGFMNNLSKNYDKNSFVLNLNDFYKYNDYNAKSSDNYLGAIEPWRFWKITFIYQLMVSLEDAHDELPDIVATKQINVSDIDNQEEYNKLENLFFDLIKINQSKNDKIDKYLNIVGLGNKFSIEDGRVIHKGGSGKDAISFLSEAENKLLTLCYFVSDLKNKIKKPAKNQYIVIDDPITSMDNNYMLNVVRLLIDLSTREHPEFHWIIFSHNTNFCDMLVEKIVRERKRQSTKFFLMHLNNDFHTNIKTYKNNFFENAIKRLIKDIYDIKENIDNFSSIDICNKARILLDIYSNIHSGNPDYQTLILDNKLFDNDVVGKFSLVVDWLNKYSHGEINLINSFDYNSLQSKNNILEFIIIVIKTYSPKIWEQNL
ncbi:AAA family ATPase [Spiroplasma endosymbiont of Amphibalanus improvisus]|uniref:AAA family ATPase n=1 Tax=Spiroplasma endosymbiont of Amphibalanus improvisus TaxID=3066327 RepID=UPI00313BFD00